MLNLLTKINNQYQYDNLTNNNEHVDTYKMCYNCNNTTLFDYKSSAVQNCEVCNLIFKE